MTLFVSVVWNPLLLPWGGEKGGFDRPVMESIDWTPVPGTHWITVAPCVETVVLGTLRTPF